MAVLQRGRMTTPIKALIRERDGNTCVDCGFTPGERDDNLHVHRPKKREPYSLRNGVSLCAKCHGRRHSKYPVDLPRMVQVNVLLELDSLREAQAIARTKGQSIREFIDDAIKERMGRPRKELAGA